MKDITIHKAEIKDIQKIAQLFDQYRVFYQQKSDIKLAQYFIQARLDTNESVIFYAKDGNGQYLGFTQLYPNFSSVSAQRIWVLNDLYVEKQARGLGIGTQLLNQAKSFAIKTKTKGIQLETSASNTGAQKLYESLGYTKNTELSYFLQVSS